MTTLQPPRRFTTSSAAKPWGNVSAMGLDVSTTSPSPAAPSAHHQAATKDGMASTTLATSPLSFHERDAPPTSASDLWKQRDIQSSVEVMGGSTGGVPRASPSSTNVSGKENAVPLAPAASIPTPPVMGRNIFAGAKTNFQKDTGKSASLPMPEGNMTQQQQHRFLNTGSTANARQSAQISSDDAPSKQSEVSGVMEPIGSAGLFKVFRPHDQSEWWQTSNRKYDSDTKGGNALASRQPDARDLGTAPNNRIPFASQKVSLDRRGSDAAALPTSNATADPKKELRTEIIADKVLGQYEQSSAANGLQHYNAQLLRDEAMKRQANRIVPSAAASSPASNADSRVGVSNIGTEMRFGVGNGHTVEDLSAVTADSLSSSNHVNSLHSHHRHNNGAAADTSNVSQTYHRSHFNATPPPPPPPPRIEADPLDQQLHHQNQQLIAINDDLYRDVNRLKQTVSQLERQLHEAQRTVEKYETMLGPLDQFTAQQVHLREEVVKLRDEVMRLVEKDNASQGRIREMETQLRRAGYNTLGGTVATTADSSKTAAATTNNNDNADNTNNKAAGGMIFKSRNAPQQQQQPPSNNATAADPIAIFIAESQHRLEELQARLSRALVLKTHLSAQLVEVEGLATAYVTVDDGISPVKAGRSLSDDNAALMTAAPSADEMKEMQKVALLGHTSQHTWRMRGKKAELELKLRSQEDLVQQLSNAVEVQREALASHQAKLAAKMGAAPSSPSDASSPPRSNTTRASSPNGVGAFADGSLAGASSSASPPSNKLLKARVPTAGNAAAIANSNTTTAADNALLSDVKPGAEAEIQRLLAVLNTKNEQIVQMRRLLEAVSASGRLGLSKMNDDSVQNANTIAATAVLPKDLPPPPLRSLPAVDVHGQLLTAASAAANEKDGLGFMINPLNGERAMPGDILYPHQLTAQQRLQQQQVVPDGVDPVALASQLWKMETENTHLNKRCTDLVLQVIEKNNRIKDLERMVLDATPSPSRRERVRADYAVNDMPRNANADDSLLLHNDAGHGNLASYTPSMAGTIHQTASGRSLGGQSHVAPTLQVPLVL